jgi:CO/xanthine dehydrogenase Mo-binding subunit
MDGYSQIGRSLPRVDVQDKVAVKAPVVPYTYVGKSLLRVDAPEKATGAAVYSCDVKIPGMLWGKCKRSPHPFAKILSIDISKALKLPGVKAVVTARNVNQFPFGEFFADQLPLCDQYARYVGDEVAAVAAIDEDIAEEAVDLIAVEYEVLKPVLDSVQAMEPEALAVHPEFDKIKQNIAMRVDFERGDGEAGFKQADMILEERFSTKPMHHCYLQPRDCIVEWRGDRVTIWAATQAPFRMRPAIARALGVPEDNVRMIPCTVGGGFGNNAARIWPIAALLAKKAGKPVKIVLTREEEFISGRPFPSAIIDLRVGFKKDGAMVAKKLDMIVDSGAYVGSCRGPTTVASGRVFNMYRLPNIKTSTKLVYTNTIPRGSLRGYGTQLTTFALESMLDIAAEKLGIDPAEIRLKNAVHRGDTGPNGFIFNSCGLSEAIRLATEKSGWRQKRQEKGNHYGIGMANAIHSCGAKVIFPMMRGGGAFVHIDENGKVQVISGETDIGQGSTMVFAQITAEELGVNIEDVKILPPDTVISPFAMGTYGDRVTVEGGGAVQLAVRDAKGQLLRQAAEILRTSAEQLELKNGKFYTKGLVEPLATLGEVARQIVLKRSGLPIVGQGIYMVPDNVVEAGEKDKYYGNYSVAYTFLTQIAEVSVDTETGRADVHRVWCAVDLGKAINPKMCEGQVEGGVMMGLGYALTEQYIFDNGAMLNPRFTDYKIATTSGIPQIHSFFIETIDPNTVYGAKGIGEVIGDPTAAVIANAIYHAVGVRIKDLPITPDKILKALKEKGRER